MEGAWEAGTENGVFVLKQKGGDIWGNQQEGELGREDGLNENKL